LDNFFPPIIIIYQKLIEKNKKMKKIFFLIILVIQIYSQNIKVFEELRFPQNFIFGVSTGKKKTLNKLVNYKK
jgi:hypothetical protein